MKLYTTQGKPYNNLFVFAILACCCFVQTTAFTQASHKLDGKLDGALLGGGAVSFGLGFYFMGKVEPMTEKEISLLDPLNVNAFDRPTTRNWSTKAHHISDITLHSAFYGQFALLLDNNTRNEIGTAGTMMAEVILINNGITNILKGTAKRRRPFTYNPNAPLDKKMAKNGRYSFFSGHASNSAAYSFFAAKVYSDNNPGSKWNPYVWSAAVTLPAVTSFLRVKAGKHFPTDVIVGYAVGAAVGFLVPELHKL